MKIKQIFNLAKLGILTVGIFVSSCTNEDFDEPIDNSSQLEKKSFMGEIIFVTPLSDSTYIEGDLVYHEDQFDTEEFEENPVPGEFNKLGLASGIRKWTDNTIVYTIQNGFSNTVLRSSDLPAPPR